MTYSLILEKVGRDHQYVHDLKKWEEVTDYLKNKLDQWTYRVYITKYSSDSRCLGERYVTMSSLWEVASSPNDKILL